MGQWRHNKQHGTGKYRWANGDEYEGGWADGLLEGEGILRQADGIRFKGTFHADGIRYEGNFSHDKKNGEFLEKDKNGVLLRRVVYKDGVPVSTIENN